MSFETNSKMGNCLDVFFGGVVSSHFEDTHISNCREFVAALFGVFGGERPHLEENPNLLHALPAVTDWHHHVG